MTSSRSYAELSDAVLSERLVREDRLAFDELIRRHAPLALRTARRLVRDPDVAEDLVQEALLRAWHEAARFDPRRAKWSTWLYRVVVNLCIDHRRLSRYEAWPERLDPIDPAGGAQEALEAAERLTALSAALAALPVRQRAAIALVYDEDLSGAEAAKILGVSTKALERLLARGRSELKDRLAHLVRAEGR